MASFISLAQNVSSIFASGMPPQTQFTKLGDEVYLNGLPTTIVGVAIPLSIKESVKFIGDMWSAEGWKVSVDKRLDLIIVTAIDENFQKVASLNKTGENTTEGSVSLTDIPRRLRTGKGLQLPVGEHLAKPVNSTVLNEVRIKDAIGESIMTTLTNQFNVEQNAAFYQERMVELGWKQKKKKTIQEGASVILDFERKTQEANFTFVKTNIQTFITVNWINH